MSEAHHSTVVELFLALSVVGEPGVDLGHVGGVRGLGHDDNGQHPEQRGEDGLVGPVPAAVRENPLVELLQVVGQLLEVGVLGQGRTSQPRSRYLPQLEDLLVPEVDAGQGHYRLLLGLGPQGLHDLVVLH